MKRRKYIKFSIAGLAALGILPKGGLADNNKGKIMPLTKVSFPTPKELRKGWAALAAVFAARGWGDDVYATSNQWFYHDGGGNWICLRFKDKNQAVLIGHDHEYTETYYGEAAKYFEEEETDILKGAPDWWGFDLSPLPFGEWIGFVYGWDGVQWQRSNYNEHDGFESVNLKGACSINKLELLTVHAQDAPGLNGSPPNKEKLQELVSADAEISKELLEAVIPGWDIEAGIIAAKKFLEVEV